MRKISAAAALLAFCAGCYQTDLARPPVSQEEMAWENVIRQSYPGYRAPKKTSRAVKGHTESRVSGVVVETPVKALEDPAPIADNTVVETPAAETTAPALPENPAEKPAEKPAQAETPAEKPADAVKPEGKPAEKPAETPAEKPADAVKPEEKTAEKPAAAVMPPDPTNSTVYVVKSGDTLGSIAQKAYGSARYSDVIFKANSDILKNPDKLKLGMKLIIPKL